MTQYAMPSKSYRLPPVTLEQVKQVFDMPLNEAALKLGRSPSKLKMELKTLKVKRWPYRRVNAIKERMRCLKIKEEQYLQEHNGRANHVLFATPYRSQLSLLEQELNFLIESAARGDDDTSPEPDNNQDNNSSDDVCSPPHSPAMNTSADNMSALYKMSLKFLLN